MLFGDELCHLGGLLFKQESTLARGSNSGLNPIEGANMHSIYRILLLKLKDATSKDL